MLYYYYCHHSFILLYYFRFSCRFFKMIGIKWRIFWVSFHLFQSKYLILLSPVLPCLFRSYYPVKNNNNCNKKKGVSIYIYIENISYSISTYDYEIILNLELNLLFSFMGFITYEFFFFYICKIYFFSL